MVALFNRFCVKLWLSVASVKRCTLGLLRWLISDSYKLSDIKEFSHD